jgi:AraC-like DNA-binding protein
MSVELRQAISDYIDANGGGEGFFCTAIGGLTLLRTRHASPIPNHIIYRPQLCMVVQGAKSIMVGDVAFDYGEMQAMIASVEVPGIGTVVEATPTRPLLVLTLELDVPLLRETMRQLAQSPAPRDDNGLGVYVHDIGTELTGCLLRLLGLLSTPHEIPVLSPLLLREIYYRLLTGANGDKLRMLGLPESRMRRVADALHLLRSDFTRPVRIEELATTAGMSASSFHQHFKQLTSMTPLQYQKHLRLLEAKRLMVAEDANVTRAALHVGYESASQFSREYVRMFGLTPKRDAVATRKLYQMHAAPSM